MQFRHLDIKHCRYDSSSKLCLVVMVVHYSTVTEGRPRARQSDPNPRQQSYRESRKVRRAAEIAPAHWLVKLRGGAEWARLDRSFPLTEWDESSAIESTFAEKFPAFPHWGQQTSFPPTQPSSPSTHSLQYATSDTERSLISPPPEQRLRR